MPRVYLTESQKENEIIKHNLELLQGKRSCIEMGKILGVSKQTYLNRVKKPDQLTICEVSRLCKYFKIEMSHFLTDMLSIV